MIGALQHAPLIVPGLLSLLCIRRYRQGMDRASLSGKARLRLPSLTLIAIIAAAQIGLAAHEATHVSSIDSDACEYCLEGERADGAALYAQQILAFAFPFATLQKTPVTDFPVRFTLQEPARAPPKL